MSRAEWRVFSNNVEWDEYKALRNIELQTLRQKQEQKIYRAEMIRQKIEGALICVFAIILWWVFSVLGSFEIGGVIAGGFLFSGIYLIFTPLNYRRIEETE